MTLKDLRIGQSGIVSELTGEGALRKHLIEMGITPGTRITVRNIAPLGDPIRIHLRGYELSLRRNDAATIQLSSALNRKAQSEKKS